MEIKRILKVDSTTGQPKPRCKFTGGDKNIFYLTGKVSKTLKRAGYTERAREMSKRVRMAHSYFEALAIMGEYVEIY